MYTPLFSSIIEQILQNRLYTIWFLGDSITSAEWIHPNWREIVEYVLKSELDTEIQRRIDEWVLQLNTIYDWQYNPDETVEWYVWRIPSWNVRTLNFGRDGSSTRDRVAQKEKRLSNHHHIDLLIMIGTCNDPDFNIPVNETVHNNDIMYAYCKDVLSIPTVLYATTSYSNYPLRLERYDTYAQKVAEVYAWKEWFFDLWNHMKQLPVADLESFYGLQTSGDKIDYTHPNVLGNCYIAGVILEQYFGIAYNYKEYYKNIGTMKYLFPWY